MREEARPGFGRLLGVAVTLAVLVGFWLSAAGAPVGAEHAVDESLGVAVTGYNSSTSVLTDQLTRIQTRWWYEFVGFQSTVDPSGFTKVELVRKCEERNTSSACIRNGPSVAQVQARAQQKHGRFWMLGNEPNTPDQDGFTPAEYATYLHDYASAIKEADPSASIVAPNVLNSTVLCQGCAGGAGGATFTQQMWTAYTTAYSGTAYATPDALVDVWALHAYQIAWNVGSEPPPWVNAGWVQGQIANYRQTLTSLGVSSNKPLWVTEWGSLLGFPCYTIVGSNQVSFDCSYDTAAVNQFIQTMVAWFRGAGRSTYNVQKTFLYANWADPEYWQVQPAQRSAAIRLFEGKTVGASLSPQGTTYSTLVGNGQLAHTPTPTPAPSGVFVPEPTATPTPEPTPEPAPTPVPAPRNIGGGGGGGGGSSQPAPAPNPRSGSPLPSVGFSSSVPPSGGTVAPPQGGLVISIPAGALSQSATFAYQPVEEPPLARGFVRPLLTFDLRAQALDGTAVSTFQKPVEIVVSYAGLPLTGVSVRTLRVEVEVAPEDWRTLPSVVDPDAKVVRAQTTHFSRFALAGEQGYVVFLPAGLKVAPTLAGRGPAAP